MMNTARAGAVSVEEGDAEGDRPPGYPKGLGEASKDGGSSTASANEKEEKSSKSKAGNPSSSYKHLQASKPSDEGQTDSGWMLNTKTSDAFPPQWSPRLPPSNLRPPFIANAEGDDDFVYSALHPTTDLHEGSSPDLQASSASPSSSSTSLASYTSSSGSKWPSSSKWTTLSGEKRHRLSDDDPVPCSCSFLSRKTSGSSRGKRSGGNSDSSSSSHLGSNGAEGPDDENTEFDEDVQDENGPAPRLSLADFRRSEGPVVRAQKLHALWRSLPSNLPAPETGPTPTSLARLPGQGTLGILSPERVERLERLYQEELVRRITLEGRPEARLWGGSDDLTEPVQTESPSALPDTPHDSHSRSPDTHQTPHTPAASTPGVAPSSSSAHGSGSSTSTGRSGKGIAWKDFRRFLWDQERDLWNIFHELDRDGDGRLSEHDMRVALDRNGISMTESTLKDFINFLASGSPPSELSPKDHKDKTYITFAEFRDFLMLLPRKASMPEIYKFYQVRKRFHDGRGAARVNMDGDLNVSFPKSTSSSGSPPSGSSTSKDEKPVVDGHDAGEADHVHEDGEEEDEVDTSNQYVAWKFLLAGGVAGAVSRTATAPFDRLKVYLITSTNAPQETSKAAQNLKSANSAGDAVKKSFKFSRKGFGHLGEAVVQIYKDGGGVRAFWVGNGLNVTKIFPESAIKFFSYEYCKRFFAKYWDCVADQSEISGTSRFISGGIGGITSQWIIYPVETLKTQLQSSRGPVRGQAVLAQTARHMWKTGGIRAYYRGLTLGLIGVFPYSAIDMSTFEALKIAWCRSTGVDEPQTVAVLAFGALSGSIGATSVYPINLLRTRLQASGSPGHPQVYTGFVDVAKQTLAREGWPGLYKGLVPTLAKVVPAVSISYVVYEHCKRSLHIS